jgi:GNAT superfamily N-acetyltransferase
MADITVSPLRADELGEAVRIFRVAFGTFVGAPDPASFMGDRDLLTPRWRRDPSSVVAARLDGRLIGSNVATRWGSFAFFGPLTVLPEFWDRGVAQRLLDATMVIFEGWGVRHSGLYTFPHSAKHVGLYQKFGYWPRYLTAVMTKAPETGGRAGALLSSLPEDQRKEAIAACRELTDGIDTGLDLSAEIPGADTILVWGPGGLDAFAVCYHGPGSEGGSGLCYVKFGAARGGAGAGDRFDRLLEACEAFAAARGVPLEAGVNLAREDAYRRMRARGYRTAMQGVAMQRPHAAGFNRGDVYAMDDWR